MNAIRIVISKENPLSAEATSLMDELSKCLQDITGDGGRSSFDVNDVSNDRALFVIARNQDGKAIGCGAFRPMDATTAEVKRMFAKVRGIGVGNEILSYLEYQAHNMGYKTIRLETRLINARAVSFYKQNGYKKIPNYGRYENRADAVCFEKEL